MKIGHIFILILVFCGTAAFAQEATEDAEEEEGGRH